MIRQSAAALTLALLAGTAMAGNAEAGNKKHFQIHGKHFKIYKHWGGPRYHGGCYWLKKKAIHTGSHYWWKRYQACKFYTYY